MQIQHASNQYPKLHEAEKAYTSLSFEYENDPGIAWYTMHPLPRPCVTPALLQEMKIWFDQVSSPSFQKNVSYTVFASSVPGIFNVGGDLNLTATLIRNRDRDGLMQYAMDCIDVMYQHYNHLDKDITTITLIEGDAFGGGLEYALSSDVIVAERSAKMGMPEILFNLFPGVGAYSLLSRKIGNRAAEKLILDGRIYTAEEMHEIGVVDVLAEDFQGKKAVYDYVSKEEKSRNGIRGLRAAKRCTNPLTYEELVAVGQIWADAALNLRDKDLRMIERLVSRQNTKVA
jgi:DSF synthase